MVENLGTTEIPALRDILRANPLYLEEAVDTREAARIIGYADSTLTTLRTRGGGPAFVKRGRKVVYTRRTLLEWLRAGQRTSTSDPGQEMEATETLHDAPDAVIIPSVASSTGRLAIAGHLTIASAAHDNGSIVGAFREADGVRQEMKIEWTDLLSVLIHRSEA